MESTFQQTYLLKVSIKTGGAGAKTSLFLNLSKGVFTKIQQ